MQTFTPPSQWDEGENKKNNNNVGDLKKKGREHEVMTIV